MAPLRLALTIPEAAKAAGIGRSSLYEEIAKGRLQARKMGRRTIILIDELNRWLSTLPSNDILSGPAGEA